MAKKKSELVGAQAAPDVVSADAAQPVSAPAPDMEMQAEDPGEEQSGVHEKVMARESERLKAAAAVRNPRLRRGLQVPGETKMLARALADEMPWRDVKRLLPDVADDVLEAWKPELERMAGFPDGEPQIPVPDAKLLVAK